MKKSETFPQSEITFTNGADQLTGMVVTPMTPQPCPAIILVHGSGPDDRDGGGTFVPIRQHFTSHGYAVLSYDKPGVGESTGDWTQQTFDDRAREVLAALQVLQTRPAVDHRAIGLYGVSQAGWIMPMVAQLTPDLAFIISISGPSVTTQEQEAYRIEAQLRADHFTEEAIHSALAVYHRRIEMIRQGATIAQIILMQNKAKNEPWFPSLVFTAQKELEFFVANYAFDPAPFLRQVRCPFLGIWGGRDTYVPVEQSVRITRQALEVAGNQRFELKIFAEADHGMRLAESEEFVPGYLEAMTEWLAKAVGPMSD